MARNSEKAIVGGKKIDEDPYFYGDDYISDSGDEMYMYNDDSGDEDFVVDKGESKEQLVDESDEEGEEHDDDDDDDVDDADFLDFDKNKMQKKKTNNKDKSNKSNEDNIPGHFVQLDHNYALVATSFAINPEHCYVKTVTRTVTPGKRKRKGPIEVRTEYFNDQEYLGTFEKSQLPEKKILGKCPRRKSKANVYPRLEDVKCLVIGGVEKVNAPRKLYNSIERGSFTGVDKKGSGTKTILLGPANITPSEPQKITVLYPENMETINSQSVIDTEKLAKTINFPKVIIKRKSEIEANKSDDKESNSVLKSEIKVAATETSLISSDTNNQKIIASTNSPSLKWEKMENSPSSSVRSILVMKRKGQSHISIVHNSDVREELDGNKDVTSLSSKIVVDETKPVIPEDADDDDDDDMKERDGYKTRDMTREEKWAFIEEASNLGHKNVCRKYKIPSSTLSNWKKRFRPNQDLQERNSDEFDEKILSAVLQEWDTSLSYPQHDVTDVVRRVLHCVDSSFVPDNDWETNFCERHKQILTMCDPLSKLLPDELEQNLKTFYENHKKNRIKNRIGDNNIICMDELPLEFFSGDSNISGAVKFDGRNPHCILLLSCCSDGSMLPPMVVFKDHKLADVSIPDKWKVLSSKDGNINAQILCQWIQDILDPFTKKNKYKYTLIWDEYIPHKEDRVKESLQANSIVPVLIPAGCSTKVQALEMGIKQSIRTSIHQQWFKLVSDWKPKSPRLGTRSSSRNLWSVEDILLWIDTALAQIEDNAVIKQACLIAGVANSLDRRHDYYIRSDKQLKKIKDSLCPKKK